MSRTRWILAALVVALLVGFGIHACRAQQIVTHAQTQADQHHEQATTAAAKGAVHDQAIEAQQPNLQADAAEVARLRAEVARLRASAARPSGSPNPSGSTGSLPPIVPVEPALEAAKDDLIQALDMENTDLKAQNADLTAARDAWRAAAGQYQQEAASLRSLIQAMPKPHLRAMGVDYGSNGTISVWGEHDFGPLRLGAAIARRQLPSINQTTVEAVVRLGITF